MHSADFGIANGSQFGGAAPKDGLLRDDPRDATKAFGQDLMDAIVTDAAPYVLRYYKAHVR